MSVEWAISRSYRSRQLQQQQQISFVMIPQLSSEMKQSKKMQIPITYATVCGIMKRSWSTPKSASIPFAKSATKFFPKYCSDPSQFKISGFESIYTPVNKCRIIANIMILFERDAKSLPQRGGNLQWRKNRILSDQYIEKQIRRPAIYKDGIAAEYIIIMKKIAISQAYRFSIQKAEPVYYVSYSS